MPSKRLKLDRSKAEELRRIAKERSKGNSRFARFDKEGTYTLRIIPFEDAEGDLCFAQEYPQWRRAHGDVFKPITNRNVFGKKDAIERVVQMQQKEGEDPDFICRTQYLVNAVDVNTEDMQVKMWQMGATVFQFISDYNLDVDEDCFDHDVGICFKVKREGSGRDTKYTTFPCRDSWPVPADLLKQVMDPLELLAKYDPGIQGQLEYMGLDLEDLKWSEEDAAETEPKKRRKAKTPVDPGEDPKEDEGAEVDVAKLARDAAKKAGSRESKPKRRSRLTG